MLSTTPHQLDSPMLEKLWKEVQQVLEQRSILWPNNSKSGDTKVEYI